MAKKDFHRGRETESQESQYQGNNIKETQGVKIKRRESVAKVKDVSLFLFLQIRKCIISTI